jgi:hypothetical protein
MMYVEQDKGQQGSMVLISEFRPVVSRGPSLASRVQQLAADHKKEYTYLEQHAP